jgi:hypothetical protein
MAVWLWLKKNWKAVLLGILTLGIGLLIGKALKKAPKVVAPELVGAGEVKVIAEEKAEEELEVAIEVRDKTVEEVEADHKATLSKLTKKQREELPKLREDPVKLNRFLLDVGKQIRDKEEEFRRSRG